jgi:hypothetical protein
MVLVVEHLQQCASMLQQLVVWRLLCHKQWLFSPFIGHFVEAAVPYTYIPIGAAAVAHTARKWTWCMWSPMSVHQHYKPTDSTATHSVLPHISILYLVYGLTEMLSVQEYLKQWHKCQALRNTKNCTCAIQCISILCYLTRWLAPESKQVTDLLWPESILIISPLTVFHTITLRSAPPDTICSSECMYSQWTEIAMQTAVSKHIV